MYYLNSRYYNPEWGRFVNVDGIIAANEDILSHNLYLYCSNNPIVNIDLDGQSIAGAIGGYVVGKVLEALGVAILKTVGVIAGVIVGKK